MSGKMGRWFVIFYNKYSSYVQNILYSVKIYFYEKMRAIQIKNYGTFNNLKLFKITKNILEIYEIAFNNNKLCMTSSLSYSVLRTKETRAKLLWPYSLTSKRKIYIHIFLHILDIICIGNTSLINQHVIRWTFSVLY